MSRTVKNQFFRKTRLVARLAGEIAVVGRCGRGGRCADAWETAFAYFLIGAQVDETEVRQRQPAVCDLCIDQPVSNTQETAAPNGVGFCDAPFRPRGGPRNGAINPHNPARSIEFVHSL